MSNWNVHWLIALLILLILTSAVCSSAETSLMALNRYRLRHLAHKKYHPAQRVLLLLKHPDRLLGFILLANTFASIFASAIATVIAVAYWGDHQIWVATVVLTLIILIFAEIAPKTLAALYPERIAFPISWPLSVMVKLSTPVLWFVNGIANLLLRAFGVHVRAGRDDHLSPEELRSLVREMRGKISHRYQQMLLRILDLEKIPVENVMIPRGEIYGIDLSEPWDKVEVEILGAMHRYIPVYRDSLDQLEGVLNVHEALLLRAHQQSLEAGFKACLQEPYYVPEGTLLSQQLRNFEKDQRHLAFVVDEYGDIQGLLSLKDILEEIMGKFSADLNEANTDIQTSDNGLSYLVDGTMNIRDLNRLMHWRLPTRGAKTLSGLLIEKLEAIPAHPICLYIAGYRIEICKITDNIIREVKIFPVAEREGGLDPA